MDLLQQLTKRIIAFKEKFKAIWKVETDSEDESEEGNESEQSESQENIDEFDTLNSEWNK
jgi:hypothetical protein